MAAVWKHNDGHYAPLLLKALPPDARTQLLLARDAEGRSALYFAMKSGHVNVRVRLYGIDDAAPFVCFD